LGSVISRSPSMRDNVPRTRTVPLARSTSDHCRRGPHRGAAGVREEREQGGVPAVLGRSKQVGDLRGCEVRVGAGRLADSARLRSSRLGGSSWGRWADGGHRAAVGSVPSRPAAGLEGAVPYTAASPGMLAGGPYGTLLRMRRPGPRDFPIEIPYAGRPPRLLRRLRPGSPRPG
jgi:hypothetical protein